MTDRTTAHATAAHTVDNPQRVFYPRVGDIARGIIFYIPGGFVACCAPVSGGAICQSAPGGVVNKCAPGGRFVISQHLKKTKVLVENVGMPTPYVEDNRSTRQNANIFDTERHMLGLRVSSQTNYIKTMRGVYRNGKINKTYLRVRRKRNCRKLETTRRQTLTRTAGVGVKTFLGEIQQTNE